MIKLRDLKLAALILLISTLCGAGANLVRTKPLSWVREPDAPPIVTSTSAPAGMSADFVLNHLANRTAFFIDARAHHEYVEGHLSGAINLPSTWSPSSEKSSSTAAAANVRPATTSPPHCAGISASPM